MAITKLVAKRSTCKRRIPATFYLANSWLENFVYRIEVKWWIMLLMGLAFLIVSLLTVTYQSWKAASRNPVTSLRDE